MEMKKNHIAVVLDDKGKCVSIAKCVIVDDTDLNKLRNQVLKHKQAEQKEKEEASKENDTKEVAEISMQEVCEALK